LSLFLAFFIASTPAEEHPEFMHESECITHLTDQQAHRPQGEIDGILKAITQLKDTVGIQLVVHPSAELQRNLEYLYKVDPLKTSRLEQLYGLFWALGKELQSHDEVEFDAETMKNLLRVSKVFPTPEFIDNLSSISTDYHPRKARSHWNVKFSVSELNLKLNDGKGYRAYQHGWCQRVDKVILYGGFEAAVWKTEKGNISVHFEEPVDFEGSFGSRGVIDVNVRYCSLFDIEFLHGSKIAQSTVRIAKREFLTTDHSWLLRLVSSLVSESTKQAIDW